MFGAGKRVQHSMLRARTLIVLGFGLAYAFLLPPFDAPDEPAHFARAYGVAEGQLVLRDHPRELVVLIARFLEKRRSEADLNLLRETRRRLREHDDRIPNIAVNTALYSPVPYFFHAVVIKLLSAFGKSPPGMLFTLYACRVTSVLVFTSLLWLTFAFLPQASWPLFWIATTPMALAQAGAVSVDYLVLGSACVLLAASLGRTGFGAYTAAVTFAVCFLLLSKPTYLPLVLVPLVAVFSSDPPERRRRAGVVCGVLAVALAGSLIWSYFLASRHIYDAFAGMLGMLGDFEFNPESQITLVLQSPTLFFELLKNTFAVYGLSLYQSFVGVFGWPDNPLPLWIVVLWGGFLVIPLTICRAPREMARRHSVILGLSCAGSALLAFAAVFVSAYMIYMPVGALTVNLQGRYFHAVAASFLIGVVFLKKGTAAGNPAKPLYFLLAGSIGVNLFALHMIVEKF
jgi:uncharacterized membrane protein